MKQSNKKHILWRYFLVVIAMIIFACMIVYDTFKTTVIYAQQWNTKADSVWLDTAEIAPERGKILADDGSVIAANLHFYTARIDWQSAAIKEDTLKRYLPGLCDSLHNFAPQKTAQQWKEELLSAKAKKKRSYRLFANLSHKEYKRLCTFPFLKKKREAGFYAEMRMLRCKPYGSMASRSIGNTGENKASKSIHGRSGLEMALDSLLYGIPGTAQRIQLTNNVVNWASIPAVQGYDITTTINVQLQDIVENALESMLIESNAVWGTAVLMEVATGEIKAISNLEWNDQANGFVEGRNNAVLGYEPGSVMKPISMMVALEDGVINNIDEKIVTGSVWTYGGRAIKDPHGGNALSPRQIIEMSSNIGMSKIVVKKYGNNPDGFRKRLMQMGFFEPYNSGIGGEQVPQFPTLGNTNADRVALTRMAFGYTTKIPPLRILGMYNAIANNGKYVRPHLVKKLSREGYPDSIIPINYVRKQVCTPENAQKLRTMLHDVVWGSHGTARKWVQSDLVEIAGKTGTAYTIENGHYGSQKRLAFCGFFPYEHPKYSCVVLMLGADRGAGASSGMVLKNIALRLYARGLLNNISDYKINNEHAEKTPTLYASHNGNRTKNLKTNLGFKNSKVFSKGSKGKGVPNVVGLDIRDAVGQLEKLGLAVRSQGIGYVASQSIQPGSAYRRGDYIYLSLRNK